MARTSYKLLWRGAFENTGYTPKISIQSTLFPKNLHTQGLWGSYSPFLKPREIFRREC